MSEKVSKPRSNGKAMTIAIVVAAIVTLAGIGLWIWQLTQGLVVTNMRNLSSWGTYITTFMFLVGLSAGGLIISSAPKLFGFKGFGGVSKVAIWTSICCTVLAIVFVIVDLGHPLKIWELFVYGNLSSPLLWDVIVLFLYLIISIVYLWATLRTEKGKGSQVSLRVLSACAFITAILVHSVTAWIFGLQQGHEMWYTALLAPWFISSALVCGTALVMVVVAALRKTGYMELAQENMVKMAKLLGVFLCVDLFFFACDLLTAGFPGAEGAHMVSLLVTGPLAVFFWAEIILSALAIVIVFVPKLRTTPLFVVASVAAIVAILCKRVQLLVGGFQIANIDYAGPLSTSSVADWVNGVGIYDSIVYFPSLIELGVSLGVVGLGALTLLLGLKYLPLTNKEGAAEN